MAFNSFKFLVFFPLVVLIYFIVPKKVRKVWLLIASYYFYMSWNAIYALLIAGSTVITYISGFLLAKTNKEDTAKRKMIVAGSFIINLGILVFFKYFDFLLDSLNGIIGIFNGGSISNPFSLLLPVGISFYTFQALGYTVDVYRGTIKAEKNFISYALFVSFFPQLVAGPIERSGNLLKQINKNSKLPLKKLFNYDNLVSGVSLMTWGMFQKMVIADRVAIFVDGIFNNLQALGFVEGMLGAMAFSIQVYCDFAGYSNIAIGAARVMGFDLMENFNTPLFARSISELWRRWHISLSTWFKDYVYIPLGGNRCSRPRKYFNIMVTFVASGLWHGANWTYVVWGGMHGLFQIIGDLLTPVKKKVRAFFNVNEEVFSFKFGQLLITYFLFCMSLIFFRANTIGDACIYLKYMFTRFDFWSIFNESLFTFGLDRVEANILFIGIFALFIVDLLRYKKGYDFGDLLLTQNLWFRWVVLILLVVFCVTYGEYGMTFDSANFIYFQF